MCCLEIWEPKPPGTLRAFPGLYRDCFTFIHTPHHHTHLLSMLDLSFSEYSQVLSPSTFWTIWNTLVQPFVVKYHKSLGSFHRFSAPWVIWYHLVCPVHALHTFIIVNYFWLHFTILVFFSVSTISPVYSVYINLTSQLPCHTLTELDLSINGHSISIQINQPTRCNNFSSLLLDVYVQLNMFRASSRPSSASRPDQYQQHCYHHAPTVKPEAATTVVELLMMGVRTPETCWAVHKRQVINLRNCCI